MTEVNLLGPSRRRKDNLKGYFDPNYDLITPGSGVDIAFRDPNTSADWTTAGTNANNIPYGSENTFRECVISTNGVDQVIVISGASAEGLPGPIITLTLEKGVVISVS